MSVVLTSVYKNLSHVQKYFGTRQVLLTHDNVTDIYAPWNMMSTSSPSVVRNNKSASDNKTNKLIDLELILISVGYNLMQSYISILVRIRIIKITGNLEETL